MFSRISKVKSLLSDTTSFSSTLQIGDTSYIDGNSQALAVQKRSETFQSVDIHFEDYEIFKRPLYIPRLNEPVISNFSNPNPFIRVGNINIIGISASSVVGVGNVGHARMESRVKHIREVPKNEVTP
ncbi:MULTISPECIES: spore germination protein GerPE [Peribacillus]|uniref:spore germination protein GerPE n=1 Tax=Peribacillus TaxID=2675229 RepID=UPI001F4E4A31|nr:MULTISPECIES: spore germination protein GerPE [unclassified Peribacillus]MCK1984357.1 spore germination protein GerPE [Peribacillus sp. Aquil_B1]MCK2008528.1 spore germination protein GerPE [Peribacillus sp. Aquil_B8]